MEIKVLVELIFLLFFLLSFLKLLISLDTIPIVTPRTVEIIGIYPVILDGKKSSPNKIFLYSINEFEN